MADTIDLAKIERALAGHHAVARAVVRRAGTGEAIAHIVLREGHEACSIMASALLEHVGRRLGAQAVPAEIVFHDALPEGLLR